MDKKKLIIGAVLVGLLPIFMVLFYFLYPKINTERYEEVINRQGEEEQIAFSKNVNLDDPDLNKEFEGMANQMQEYLEREDKLNRSIDSLKQVNDSLNVLMAAIQDSIIERSTTAPQEEIVEKSAGIEGFDENFSDRIKSLLNLDEEELAPIVDKMNKDQLVRLYQGGGSIQREKLLRALKPERAAELMQTIML
jgi:hypothetical protein